MKVSLMFICSLALLDVLQCIYIKTIDSIRFYIVIYGTGIVRSFTF